MTKRYILPTWEEFSKDRMVLVGYTNDPFTVKVGDRPVRKDDYNAIREATAVEDGRSPLATEALVEFAKNVLRKQNRETLASLKADDTVTLVMDAPAFVHLWYLAHGEESPMRRLVGDDSKAESERLVGKARGEVAHEPSRICRRTAKPVVEGYATSDVTLCDCLAGDLCKIGLRDTWADVGGGEEKPVRAAAPAANKPRCDNCRFGHVVKNPINDGVMCQRFPQHRFIDSDDAPVHWCGEWRAK